MVNKVLASTDKLTWYPLLVGGSRYPVKLVEVCASWPPHHDNREKMFMPLFQITSKAIVKGRCLIVHTSKNDGYNLQVTIISLQSLSVVRNKTSTHEPL